MKLAGRRGSIWALLVAGGLVAGSLAAQTAVPPVAPAASGSPAAASSPLPQTAASAVPAERAASAAAAAPKPALGCRPLTDLAMAADLKVATAQSQRKSPAELAELYEEATDMWQQAVENCEGRARERAERNLQDTRQAGAGVMAMVGAGPQCANSHRDADALQELAKVAFAERRWSDAAYLYRKAEGMWEATSERCAGVQQQTALKRRAESETDAHNAEFCAPLFDRARSQLQRLRSAGSAAKPEDKARLSLLVETSWRDATGQCRGSALDLARNNAQATARERGTPWVATREVDALAPGEAVPPGSTAGTTSLPARAAASLTADAGAATTSAAPATAAAGGAAALTGARPSVPASSLPSALSVPARPAPAATAPAATMPPEFVAEGTRFIGRFVTDAGGATYSGTGKVIWANGDVYEGAVVNSLRHGQGKFVWASGQRFEGDWVQGVPAGQGRMQFANGNLYEGAFQEGLPTGAGRLQYASGDVYNGELLRGDPHGRGSYEWLGGQRLEGEWRNGQAQGPGKMRFSNGNAYEGPVRDGKPHGTGRLVFTSGDVYSGNFQAGLPDGEGRFVWASGDQYTGQWKAGQKEGPGLMTWKNGDRWEGTYRADAQAEGKLTRAKPP